MDIVKDFLNYLKFEKRYSQHTIKSYTLDLNQFLNFLDIPIENLDVSKIDERVIRDWIVKLLDEGNSTRSVNRKITTLKTFFRYLIREDITSVNPLDKIVAPKTL